MARPTRALLPPLLVLLLTAACSSPPADTSRSAEQVARDAAAAMAGVESAGFTVEHDGDDLFIDDAGLVAFRSAEGRYAAPASTEAVVAVDAGGFRTEVGAVAIDGEIWMTDPITGTWGEAPANFTFDPARLFDPDEGIPAVLDDGASAAELVEDDSGDDSAPDVLRMTVPRDQVAVLTSGLVASDTEVDLQLDPETDRVVELAFETTEGDNTSSWLITFNDYDETVTIEPPELGSTP